MWELGWSQEFSEMGAESFDEGAKFSQQGTATAKNSPKRSSSTSDGGLACPDKVL